MLKSRAIGRGEHDENRMGEKNYPDKINDNFLGGVAGCPKDYDGLCKMDRASCLLDAHTAACSVQKSCESCWNAEINFTNDEVDRKNDEIEFVKVAHEEAEAEQTIKDSGNRREFSTGAVRDMAEGKGRCDLLPLTEVSF